MKSGYARPINLSAAVQTNSLKSTLLKYQIKVATEAERATAEEEATQANPKQSRLWSEISIEAQQDPLHPISTHSIML